MTQPFHHILAVQDAYRDSVEALEWACRLVPANGSVEILDVQPPLSALWRDIFKEEHQETPVFHRKKSLNQMVRGIEFPTGNVTSHVRSGTPVVEIVNETLDSRVDLVVKEAFSKASDFIFGSLDTRLLRHCPIPVWLAHPNSPHDCSRILVALNPEADEKEMQLNKRLLQYASQVARGFNGNLFVVGAFHSHETAFPILKSGALSRFERHSKTAAQKAKESLNGLLSESLNPVDPDNVILAEGSPDEVILDTVQRVKPELLVMGSVARHGVSGLLLGNAAERVLRQVDCSVLTVKPMDFVSPIAPIDQEGMPSRGRFAY